MAPPSLPVLLLALAPAAPAAPGAPPSAPPGPQAPPGAEEPVDLAPLEDARRLVRRLESSRDGFAAYSADDLRREVGDLLAWSVHHPGHEREVDGLLLDLLGLCLDPDDPARSLADRPGTPSASPADATRARLRVALGHALAGRLDDRTARWMAREVLMIPRLHPRRQRVAAAWLLARERPEEGCMALLVLARGEDVGLAELAVRGLVGWDDPAVHKLFLDLEREPPEAYRTAALTSSERHFQGIRFAGNSPLEVLLADRVKRGLASVRWQDASRAVGLSEALSDESAVPLLIEALRLWAARAESGVPSLRVRHEVAQALERRSGRSIGLRPERWQTWWAAVRRGQTPLVPAEDAAEARSEARFFGLRPMSDRIAFLIDRSGSMREPFAAGDRTSAGDSRSRYDEAIEQVIAYLRSLGPRCRFRLVVFSNGSDVWHKSLKPADDRHLRSARSWLAGRGPDGGTNLRGGVERALDVRRGAIDVERLGVDTVVVLCDGATDRGPGWVDGFLDQVNAEARIVFHCVQIGDFGDGTLERLAERTGGDYVLRR